MAAGTLPALRFITCGSVDDGKSTLIGRLLHESECIFDDQRAALEQDSRQYGTQGGRIDYALLLDGLQAEREQGITIDVAYRYFSSPNRRCIVADTPGHEQYTRNMATGASTADLAVILVDARKGILEQTRRHARIAAMMGIRQVVLAVNKMDLVGFDRTTFETITAEFAAFAALIGPLQVQPVPLCALDGDNVVQASARTPWYRGPSLLACLDAAEAGTESRLAPLRLPVQWVNRPHQDFRGFCGRIAQGEVVPGMAVRILPSGVTTRVRELVAWQGTLDRATAGDSVTLTLADEVDVIRGDMIVAADAPPEVADQFEARLLWMSEQPLVAGRPYLFKLQAREVAGTVSHIKHREEVSSGAHLAARSLGLNEIGLVNLSLARPVAFEPYEANRLLGSFIMIDKLTLETVGAGMIVFALRRASNIHAQAFDVDRAGRARLLQQAPHCIWFTGLSGSGKSTIANLLERRLHAAGRHTFVLDGDNLRHGLNRDLGFTEADRVENIRRVAEVARLMTDAGLIVLVALVSPFRAERRMARERFPEGEFMEVFVDTPLEDCERRDPKGLYAKARSGALKNFTGIDSAYQPPLAPELHLRTRELSAEACAEAILTRLEGTAV